MYVIILRLFWPFLQRYAAGRIADYLQARKERRLAKMKQPVSATIDQVAAKFSRPVAQLSPSWLTNNPVWFMLSGMLLGSALTFALTRLIEPGENS